MRNFKRFAAIVIAVTMLVSLTSIGVFAATESAGTLIDLTLTADKTNIQAGDSVDISIDFTPKSGEMFIQGAVTFELKYDKSLFDASVKSIDASWEGTSDTNFIGDQPQFGTMTIISATGAKTNIAVITFTAKTDIPDGDYSFSAEYFAGNTTDLKSFGADITNATVTVGGEESTPTETPTVEPTATPTVEPTATPEPSVSVTTGSATIGKDFTVTVTRTDATEDGTVLVTLTKEGVDPITKTVTIPAGDTSVKVVFTEAELAPAQLAAKDKVAVSVTYDGEAVKINGQDSKTVTFKNAGSSSSNNSGLSTNSDGSISTPVPGDEGPSTETTPPDTTVTPAGPVTEPTVFTDVPVDYWGYDYIMELYDAGIISGATATTFLPENNITRAEFTKIAVGVFGLTATSTTSQFTDVPSSEWFAPYVIAATEAGIVQGVSATEFGPNDNITREQMATIIGRQLGLSSDSAALTYSDASQISDYAKSYVGAMSTAGYLTGDNGQFRPQDNATRAEAATLLDRVYTDLNPAETETATAAPEATEESEADATATPEAEESAE